MEGKKILIGVCGSIAAYKSALLVRLLVKAGCEVRVVMTSAAKDFITPLTLSTLSKHPVASEFTKGSRGEWENHVEMGLWADLMLIAPTSAHTMAKMANGQCDNLLTAVYLSAKCPVIVAPAMDLDMYQHPSTVANIDQLKSYGNTVLEAEFGELASGLVGNGRMMEPEDICAYIEDHFKKKSRFEGKKVLITAGPTHEKLDPVRFIGNNSSGKMGLAIASAFVAQGAKVTLVAGPGVKGDENPSLQMVSVSSADEMYQAALDVYGSCDIAVFAAAVADYRPATVATEKIKKSGEEMTISLVKNKDIAAELGKAKRNDQFNVGFALETENEVQNAQGKLERKNFDMIVLNSLRDAGAGFSGDTNKITIFHRGGTSKLYSLQSKTQVAKDILDAVHERTNKD